MKKILPFLLLFIACQVFGQTKVSSVFDFSHPNTLNPSVYPSNINEGDVNITGRKFTDGTVALYTENSVSLHTFIDASTRQRTYSLCVNSTGKITLSVGSNDVINSVVFEGYLANLTLQTGQYGDWTTNGSQTTVKFDYWTYNTVVFENNKSTSTYISKITVNFTTKSSLLVPVCRIDNKILSETSATEVSALRSMTLSFDRPMTVSNANGMTLTGYKTPSNEEVSQKLQVSEGNGTNTLTLVPQNSIITDGNYTITIPSGTFVSSEGIMNKNLSFAVNVRKSRADFQYIYTNIGSVQQYLAMKNGVNAISDVDLNNFIIYANVGNPYSGMCVDTTKQVRVEDYYTLKRYRTGHLVPYYDIVEDYGPEFEGTEAAKLVLDEPIKAGDIPEAYVNITLPEGTIGDHNFGRYIGVLNDGVAVDASDCIANPYIGDFAIYVNNKWAANTNPTTYSLSIIVNGNGSATYDGTTIRSKSTTFTVNEGTNAAITFTPDNGYRIKNLKVNNSDVTSSISNSQYTVNNIKSNTTVEVEFEAIPPMTYTMSIKAIGNGSASYNGTTIRSKTSTYSVDEGTNATITFAPDNGYQIKSVIVNSLDVTSYVSNNSYTISNIKGNTTIEVEFEAIPATTYTLSIKASGNGSASYNGVTIRSKTSTFTVNEGSNAIITFSSDNGYRIKSVKVNNTDVTYVTERIATVGNNGNWFIDGKDTGIPCQQASDVQESGIAPVIISNIRESKTVEVEFEAIPATTYSLSIKATGNGSVTYNGTTIRSKTSSFTVNEGTNATITFTPDNGYRIKSVSVNSSDVSSYVSNNSYTISNIKSNTTVEVEFEEKPQSFTYNGVNYSVVSYNDYTVRVSQGNYGTVLEVPAKFTYQNTEWTVTGIDNEAITNNPDLAAIIWNPTANFTASVGNPNLLLYVTSASYAPTSIKNVVVNGSANSITLTDENSGNNFYCPQEFTAKAISYMHNYSMITGIGESKGWETIALPFDVQKITHSSKGEIVPFANWKSGDSKKPFWLMELSSGGFAEANAIKANTPYIISMPNNTRYKNEFRLNGNVTFSADNVKVRKSDDLHYGYSEDKTFIPNFGNQERSDAYVLNVNNGYVSYNGDSPGSHFYYNLRSLHPFEAYMTSSSKTRAIAIQDNMTTGIRDINEIWNGNVVRIYNLSGQMLMIEVNKSLDEIKQLLSAGVYIVNGKKLIIK